MARTATTADVFNAIAEETRRDILDALVGREVAVGELVTTLDLGQPQVSKHLKVLRAVDLVRCRTQGRHRLYRLNGPALEPVQRWLEQYTVAVNEHYDRLDDYLATLQRTATTDELLPGAADTKSTPTNLTKPNRASPNPTKPNHTNKETRS
jgi:DNA-binding transcriptional ArsR family regulator